MKTIELRTRATFVSLAELTAAGMNNRPSEAAELARHRVAMQERRGMERMSPRPTANGRRADPWRCARIRLGW